MGIGAGVVTAAVLPSGLSGARHVIDYAGTALIGAAATCLVLLTSLGGTTFPWGSIPIILFGVLAVVFVAGFVAVERRGAAPPPPLRPFANRVFPSGTLIAPAAGVAIV